MPLSTEYKAVIRQLIDDANKERRKVATKKLMSANSTLIKSYDDKGEECAKLQEQLRLLEKARSKIETQLREKGLVREYVGNRYQLTAQITSSTHAYNMAIVELDTGSPVSIDKIKEVIKRLL